MVSVLPGDGGSHNCYEKERVSSNTVAANDTRMREKMAEKPDKEQQLKSLAEALKMEMIINQALIDVLVEKGILTHDEIMAKTREIKIKQGIVLSSEASNKASN